MTKFDVIAEKMQEERVRKQNEKWNAMLLQSLRTRTKEDVLQALMQTLIIPIGSANVLSVPTKELALV